MGPKGGSSILNTSEEFSRKDNYKKSTLKPPDYHGQYKELEN